MDNSKTQVGQIITNPPRAVMVRSDPEHLDQPHSAVVANITILTENRLQTQAVLDNWSRVASALNDRVLAIVGEIIEEKVG